MMEEEIGCGGFPLQMNENLFSVWGKLPIDLKKACLAIDNGHVINQLLSHMHLAAFQIDGPAVFRIIRKTDQEFLFEDGLDASCETVGFVVRHMTPCLNILEFATIYVNSRSSVSCIFDGEQRSNKILFLDLVSCSLQEITAQIAALTQAPDVLEVSPDTKRRFVLQKDYSEYFDALVNRFTGQGGELKLVAVVKALLTLLQNNIFYNVAKVTKLIKFYKLNWKDDVRILANSRAFKAYLHRSCLDSLDKKTWPPLSPLDSQTFAALTALKGDGHMPVNPQQLAALLGLRLFHPAAIKSP